MRNKYSMHGGTRNVLKGLVGKKLIGKP